MKDRGFLEFRESGMSRFVLRYQGKGRKRPKDVRRIRALPKLDVIDDSSPRMLLVDAPESELKSLIDSLTDWIISPEQIVQLPDPRLRPTGGTAA